MLCNHKALQTKLFINSVTFSDRLIEEAIHNYRSLLRVIETKATVNARKV